MDGPPPARRRGDASFTGSPPANAGPPPDMAAAAAALTDDAAAIESEAARGHTLDRELAARLERPARALGQGLAAEYLRDVGSRPTPSLQQERDLVAAAQRGDRRARAELIEMLLPLISGVARGYRGARGVDRLELLQEGAVGVLRALERYDADRGVPFWGYASWWVRQAMQQLVAELTRPATMSDRALRQLARVKEAHRAALQRTGREPSIGELNAATGLGEDQIGRLLAADTAPASLDAPSHDEPDELGAFGELLSDPLAEDEYEEVLRRAEGEQLRALLGRLSERERRVLADRYLDGRSLRDIGARLGVSGERVRQVEQRALGKLRAGAGEDT